MTYIQQGFEPYYPAFIAENLNMVVELNPLVQPIINGNIIGYNCWWRNIFFDPEDTLEINNVLEALKGQITLQEISEAAHLEFTTVQSIIETLYEVGIVKVVSADELPALSFYRHVVAVMRSRRHKALQQNPLIAIDTPSALNKRLLLGLLVEGYHFSSSAASHISLAIAQTKDKTIEEVLSRYLSEEYWHGNLLAKGLLQAGISKEELKRSIPTFPVLGIINFLRDIARTDIQAYGLCLALTESNTSSNVLLLHKQEVWDYLKSLELVPDATLDAYFEHDRLDYSSKHDEVPEIIFQAEPPILLQRQQALFHIAQLYIDMIEDAYKYLKAHYASPNGQCWFELQ